ncbi:MAG TPA: hypothetical protein VFW19_03880 [Allosphingosinicella sp.]|nr:hypothetical protein [Allosphingosinicella sp.]
MADVAVRRLRIGGPPERAPLAAFFVEDGCRTSLPDSERLVLLRRLRLPAAAAQRHAFARNAAIAKAWRAATARARHGAADGAWDSECVWFADRAEARRLLLALLLAGRRPNGWFWRLAVPEWEDLPLALFVRRLVAAAAAKDDGVALPALALQIVEAGRADLVIEALAGTAPAPHFAGRPPVPPVTPTSAQSPGASGEAGVNAAAAPAARIAALRARLPGPLRDSIEALARRLGPRTPAARLLLERLLLRASPDLRLARARLTALAETYADLVAGETRAEAPGPPPAAEPVPTEKQEEAQAQTPPPHAGEEALRRPPADAPLESADEAAAESLRKAEERPAQDPREFPAEGMLSAYAGLWLVVPALIRLGWREWLLDRPGLIGTDPGRTLIAGLAAHHRVAFDDPALAPLEFAEPPPVPDWAEAWRRALARAFRRSGRINLACLIRKPGRLSWAEERLIVRFPMTAIDLRLRRRALDVDPGWVDWLGFSVRYVYSAEGEG